MSEKRTIDLLVGAFDLNQRRKFTLKKPDGSPLCDLYFKPITRSDRTRVQALANSDDALKVSTQMLVHMAEKENGEKAFMAGDAIRLQRELPETVLNDLELFLFNVSEDGIPLSEAKND
tara:strand:+ start:2970 stop:3326 length:357 start_codon:yes stop_codon:yes gene_type:complete